MNTTSSKKAHIVTFGLMLCILAIALLAVLSESSTPNAQTQESPNQIDPTTTDTPSNTIARRVDPRSVTAAEGSPAAELRDFALWLYDNNVQGFVGETGWPDNQNREQQAQEWLDSAVILDVPFTLWAAGSAWPQDYPLRYFNAPDKRVLSSPTQQAELVTDNLKDSDLRWGINVAGLEFGTNDEFSNTNPGVLGTDYFFEDSDSYKTLAESGVTLVRLPFAWERLQPSLNGPLDSEYLQLIADSVDNAAKNNIDVILDLHNYGRYQDSSTQRVLGANLSTQSLVDIWQRLHEAFAAQDNIYAYGLMNEPHNLDGGASTWETVSQEVVTQLRASSYKGKILVSGYDYGSTRRWTDNHATPWIDDSTNQTIYEAHHYWDSDGSGRYVGEGS